MRKYTVADIMALDQCYEIQRVEQLWDGRESLSLAEICRLDIGLTDIIWVASELLPQRSARLYTCDCAEHVLWRYEREHPADARPRECIDIARRYTDGDASEEELDAGWVAARDAARDAAYDDAAGVAASMSANRSADAAANTAAISVSSVAACNAACAAADAAAYDAAGTAAWAVTCDAVGVAARRTERKWQLGRLIEYVTEAEKNPMKGRAND